MKKSLFTVLLLFLCIISMTVTLSSCTPRQATRVSYNISQEADNFNIYRRLTVINVLSTDVIFEMTGNFSINKAADGDLEVIGQNDDGLFYKHFINLKAFGSTGSYITYIVEDLGSNYVSRHHYTINLNPAMWIPFDVDTID